MRITSSPVLSAHGPVTASVRAPASCPLLTARRVATAHSKSSGVTPYPIVGVVRWSRAGASPQRRCGAFQLSADTSEQRLDRGKAGHPTTRLIGPHARAGHTAAPGKLLLRQATGLTNLAKKCGDVHEFENPPTIERGQWDNEICG